MKDMKYRTLRFFLSSLAVALLAGACQVEEPLSPEQNDGDENLIPVTVSLKLNVAGEAYGTPQTRAIDDPGTVQNTQIKNMVVLQYAGTSDDARLVGGVHYLDASVTDPEDEHYLGNMEQIKLAYSMGETHTLIFLTNTFTEIRAEETLGAMLRLWREAGGEPDVFGHEGDSHELDPDNTDYYQRMNAIAVTEVDNDMTIYGVLRRSMARINVEIVNNDTSDGLRIRKVWMRNVSQKDYYITDYTYLDPSNPANVLNLRDYDFQDEFVPSLPMRTDYAQRDWTGTNPGGEEGTGTATYRWYVPANMRGTDATNTLPEEKNRCPNVDGATYLYILGEYGDAHDQAIVYKFYLGENLTNNFDLKPNTSYSYRFTFNGKGKTTADLRIEDFGNIDFTVDANCYILNPPDDGLDPRKYTINVVHRPNIFWGSSSSNDRYGNFADYPNNYIHGTETWYARIIWADFNYDQNAVLTRNTGTGAGSYTSSNQRIELTIPSDITHGNMVIGVYTDDPTNILWSWHIWITDYQPDDRANLAPAADTYVYTVTGGEVHRYNNVAFNTGGYKDAYIMDRNLGALDQKTHNQSRGGGFFYQYGRKDPFPNTCTIYKYDYGVSAPSSSASGQNNISKISSSNTNQGGKNVPYSINHPFTFIYNSPWTSNDIYSSHSSSWLDPYPTVRSDNEETGKNADKPFFDPCPPGWRIPRFCWNGFVLGNISTSSTTANLIWDAESSNGHNRGRGLTYYPNTYLADKTSDVTAFYPLTGDRWSTGEMHYVDTYTVVWYLSPDYSYLVMRSNAITTNGGNYPGAIGCTIRCVRE